MIGIVPTDEALRMARDSGLDLVEVSPNERPPVCRIMDYGKHKYDQSKKLKQKHHEQRIKEVRLRPKTDPHDKEIKLKRARTFLEHGDRVQFTMLFRGRERFHKELGLDIFDEIVKELEEIAKLDRPAKALGRRMTMVLAPIKAASPQGKSQPKAKGSSQSKTPKPSVASNQPNQPPPPQAVEPSGDRSSQPD
ncbi:MAG: translation initiation factor IF-3 [Phycisphaerales bacterium]|nr:translation initiation factor IF-3 [Phycisphaerales bacterium]